MISATFAVAQSMKQYSGKNFSLSYPSSYTPAPINNAPHMCLKLKNDNYIFTASYWDKGYSEGTSIWDDEIYEACKSLPVNGNLLAVDKITVPTKQDNRRSIRVISTIKENYSTICSVSYLMIQDSFLYIFAFFSDNEIFLSKDLDYQKRFLKGLTLHHITR
jgi:hypothetical protein